MSAPQLYGLEWGDQKRVETARGTRWVSEAKPTEALWEAWRASKVQLKAAGFGISKYEGEWKVSFWEVDEEAEKRYAASREASRAAESSIVVPRPPGLADDYKPFQKAGIEYALARSGTLIGDEMGLGKAQPLSAKILTPSGWLRMGDLVVGDLVIGSDGKSTRVIGIFPQGERNCYRVTFSDGAVTECCDEHLWEVSTAQERWAGRQSTVKSLGEIRETLRDANGNSVHFIPMVNTVQFREVGDLPLHPWLLGILLGDGGLSNSAVRLTSADASIIERVNNLLPSGVTAKHIPGSTYDYNITGPGGRNKPNPITRAIRALHLNCRSESKFIPTVYKLSSPLDRLELLRGLMDADGHCRADGTVEFDSTSSQLADDVCFIVQSLGGVARRHERANSYKKPDGTRISGKPSIRLIVAMPGDTIPFWLARKALRWKPREKYGPARAFRSVELVGRKWMQCIKVDAPDQLYVTDDFIVTHNTIQFIGLANMIGAKLILLACPASLKINWRTEITKWQTLGLPVHVIDTKSRLPMGPLSPGWYIINWEAAYKFESKLKANTVWDLVGIDEAQNVRNNTAQRTRFFVGGRVKTESGGTKEVPGLIAERRVCMTGTPICNRPLELWPLIHWLDPKNWQYVSKFKKMYCGGGYDADAGVYRADGATNLDALQVRLRETVMVRRLKSQVMKELPPKFRQVIALEIDEDDERTQTLVANEMVAHERMEDEIATASYEAQRAEAEGDSAGYEAAVKRMKAAKQVAFTEISRMRHVTAVAKVPYVLRYLQNMDEVGKIVIIAHHNDVVHALAEGLRQAGKRVLTMTQATPIPDRKAIEQQFQNDPKIDYIIGTFGTMGVGFTLTAASFVAMPELDWVPGNVTQAEDRVHRIGQNDHVTVQHLVFDGSLDSKMAKILIAKQEIIDKALDRPVEVTAPTHTAGDAAGAVQRPVDAEAEEEVSIVPTEEERIDREPKREAPVATLTQAQIEAVHTALRIVAGMDGDGARALNGVGFSKFDTMFGRELAERSWLSPRQAAVARKMVTKYKRQYPVELFERMHGSQQP